MRASLSVCERDCVFVCACLCERETVCVRVRVCERETVSVCVCEIVSADS